MKIYKNASVFLLLILCLSIFVCNSHAAILDVRAGQLFGASGVDVEGVLYDVAFRDGTAIELFNGADENSDFPFTDPSNLYDTSRLYAAMTALLDQVFIDTPAGAFDSNPELTNGCGNVKGCVALTPFRIGPAIPIPNPFPVHAVLNSPNDYGSDYVAAGGYYRNIDTHPLPERPEWDRYTYAVWSETSAVPIPGAVWLLGSGFAIFVGLRRKMEK